MKPAYKRAALALMVALGMLSVVPGVAFAANPACGTTIMSNVTLTSDMDCSASGTDGLIFGKKGLTINLNGYTLWGPDGDDDYDGIDTDGKKNVTVKNGTIARWGYAVYVYATVGGTFKNLTIIGDAETHEEGIYVYYGANNLVTNNTVDDVGYGIDVEYSAGNWITNNTVTDAYDAFYGYLGQGDRFIGNRAIGYSDTGFYDEYGANNTYNNNRADPDGDGGGYGFYFYCYEYGWVTAKNNWTANNSDDGFYIYECYDYYSYSSFQASVISGNTSVDNDDNGFYDYYSLQAKYMNNTANRNGDDGFYFDYPGGLTVTGNTANRNDSDGMEFYDMGYGNYGNPKVVSNNTTNRNGDYGILADYGIGNATGNKARNNGTSPDDCWNVPCN
jgi:parallel beta-helix repeat protein